MNIWPWQDWHSKISRKTEENSLFWIGPEIRGNKLNVASQVVTSITINFLFFIIVWSSYNLIILFSGQGDDFLSEHLFHVTWLKSSVQKQLKWHFYKSPPMGILTTLLSFWWWGRCLNLLDFWVFDGEEGV